MKTACVAALASVGAASAFVAPTAFTGNAVASIKSTSAMKMAAIESEPGATAPLGFWDPLGLSEKATPSQLREYQTAELKHGRVAMLAAVGMIVQENFHPLFPVASSDIGPAIDHYQLIESFYPKFWIYTIIAVGLAEFNNIGRAYTKMDKSGKATIIEDGIIGDFGFDPFGIVGDSEKFTEARNKELNNGRLAMFAIIGQWAQELVNGKELLANLN